MTQRAWPVSPQLSAHLGKGDRTGGIFGEQALGDQHTQKPAKRVPVHCRLASQFAHFGWSRGEKLHDAGLGNSENRLGNDERHDLMTEPLVAILMFKQFYS